MEARQNKGGRPKGIPRQGRYGLGVETKTVRVPKAIADNIAEILKAFEGVRELIDEWGEKIDDAASKSSTGKPSPRYERAVELLTELRKQIGE